LEGLELEHIGGLQGSQIVVGCLALHRARLALGLLAEVFLLLSLDLLDARALAQGTTAND
jgi:hypothetical protein